MKKLFTILILLALIAPAHAVKYVINGSTTTDEGWITEPIALYDTGFAVWARPDSMHVLVWRDSSLANAATWTWRGTATDSVASAVWDTAALGGAVYHYFRNPISAMDGDGILGNYSGLIAVFKRGAPTTRVFSFGIIDNDTTMTMLANRINNMITIGNTLGVSATGLLVGIGANGIDATSIQTGAIDADAIANTAAREIAETTWTTTAGTGRSLTILDEDLTTIDLNGSSIGTVVNGVTVDVNDDKTGYSLSSTGVTDIWNVSYATAWTAGSMGDSLNNPTYMGAWNLAFTTSFVAGSMGDSLNNPTYSGSWNLPFTNSFVAGSMGDSLNNPTYSGSWNAPFTTSFVGGSMGDSLTNASYMQGAASGVTIAGILGASYTAYNNADSAGKVGYALALGDTANNFWVDLSDETPDFDSIDYNSASYRAFIDNHGGGSTGLTPAEMDSVLTAENILKTNDSVRVSNWIWDNDLTPRANRDVDDIASFDGSNDVTVGSMNNNVITKDVIEDGMLTPVKFDTSFFRVAADTLLRRTVTSPAGPIPPTSIATYIPNISSYIDGDGVSGSDARILEIQEDIGDPSNQIPATRVAWATDDSLGNLTISDTTGLGITITIDTASFFDQMKNEGFVRKVGFSNDSLYAALNAGIVSAGIESLLLYVGHHGVSTPTVSLHMKLGDYSGVTNVKEDIANIAGGGGSGIYDMKIYIKSGGSYLANAQVDIVPSGGTPTYRLWTNTSGYVTFSQNAGTYYCRVQTNGYTQNVVPDTFVVSANYQDTVLMTTLTSDHPQKARIYANTYDLVGEVVPNATLRIVPKIKGKAWTIGVGSAIVPKEIAAVSDANGLVYADVFRSPRVLSGVDTLRYDISIAKSGYFTFKADNRIIPDTNSWAIR